MKLPLETERCASVFRTFYLSRHKGRRLEFQYSEGSADLKLNCGRKYEINVPTTCLGVVMLFQGDEILSVADIAARTGMAIGEAARAVASLSMKSQLHTGILRQHTQEQSGAITSQTAFSFHSDFRSKHFKVRINPVAQKEPEKQAVAPKSRVDEDRKYKIDAAIVRIMKSRRTMDHKSLAAEVTTVLRNSFVPQAEEIKRRIEHLIEREFIERSEESRNSYNYLA